MSEDQQGILSLSDITDDEVVQEGSWFSYDTVPGFRVRIAPIEASELERIAYANTTMRKNPKTGKREPYTDTIKATKDTALRVVKGWEGLTVAGLLKIIPLPRSAISAQDEDIVAFSTANLLFLIQRGRGFAGFIDDILASGENFSEGEAARKNS